MNRRLLTLLAFLLAVAVAAFAAGCGGDDEGDDGDAAPQEEVSGSVSIMGIWVGEEQKSFQAVIDGFNEQQPNVTVNYNPVGDNLPTVLSTAVEGGNPPDIAAIAQPGLMQQYVEQNRLQSLDFLRDTATENFGESVVETGSVEDTFYGLLWKTNNKSTVWYNVSAFEQAGVEPPESWEDFLSGAETIKASGLPAYSIAGADGWTLTDLFENIYVRTAGAEKYTQLANHEIPWTDESVKEALREMAKVLSDSDNIAGGTQGALQTDFPTSVSNVFTDDPRAAQVIEGDFVPGVVETQLQPGEGYDWFRFPSINDSPEAVIGSGNLFVTFRDTPAVRAFMQYLTTPESAQIWIERGGFVSPNRQVESSAYTDETLRATSEALAEAETFRFDLSDMVPAAFGATTGQGLWKLLQDFLRNPQDVDGIAEQLEQAAQRASG
ncbi:MAG: carbohydrate ABC transporter substrate-binding protein [Thermoleophilia bacterium]|nr:carbohydrate ABC transporter substrate-binding protein [Thermoleophilia bacterium]